MSERLNSELQKKLNEKRKVYRATIDPLIRLKVPEGNFSPLGLVMQTTEAEIARQLTLIEFQIFARIKVILAAWAEAHFFQPSELLNQAWSNPKFQYRSANVLSMVTRANTTAFCKEMLESLNNQL
jgi:hypothetical protein